MLLSLRRLRSVVGTRTVVAARLAPANRYFSTTTPPEKEEEKFSAEEELVKWDPEASNPLHLHVTFEDVSRAVYKIRSGVKRTYCDYSAFLSEICGCKVYLKKDLMQFTGSFKERGARNALLNLTKQEREAGVVCASAGNHALAMAYHGQGLNIPVTCVMPKTAPLAKVDKCRKFGANIVLHGMHIGDAREHAKKEFANIQYVNGYDHRDIIAGAGTMGVEIFEQVPDVDAILVPTGGGGLLAGVAVAMKALKPETEIVAVEPEMVPSYREALKAGKPVSAYYGPTLADGLAVPVVGPNAFAVARYLVDSTCVVSESMISTAILRLVEMEKMVTEGGGAIALASILPGGPLHGKYAGKTVVLPVCGGNVDTPVLGRVLERGLAADSRLIRFDARLQDRPGGVASLTRVIADSGASIKDIYHERAFLADSIADVDIRFVVETTGKVHTEQLYASLRDKGYKIRRSD